MHLRNLNDKPWYIAALPSWDTALLEYLFQVPGSRTGYTVLSPAQLKILQEAITLVVFVPFAMFYMQQPIKMDFYMGGAVSNGRGILYVQDNIMIKINQLLHTGLIISDLEKSRAFYEGLLGLKPNPNRPDFGFPGVWYDIGINQIHLMAIPDPDVDSIRPEHGGRDYHVALAVSDIDAVKAELDKAGVAYRVSKSGRAALFCRDPDGNALEFSAVEF